jgi:Mlc titration factor MtfA (ptsG expression regulator)
MPQDSTYVIHGGDTAVMKSSDTAIVTTSDTSYIPDVQRAMHSFHDQELTPRPENNGTASGTLAAILLVGVAFVGPIFWGFIRRKWNIRLAQRSMNLNWLSYDNLLQKYNPYYKNLDQATKDRFLKRTVTFMTSKKFEFQEMQREEHIPLLISAASVTLTFGLKHYLLDYFDTIYVLPNVYRYGFSEHPFEGHVNRDGITLSWNKFLEEYSDASDGNNVGLHEMAHALAYVNFTVHEGSDHEFKTRYIQFKEAVTPIFEKVRAGETAFLGEYASTNYEEFWAVSVEHFFERPQLFKDRMPELYKAMCTLLNQDLLRPGVLIEPVEEV